MLTDAEWRAIMADESKRIQGDLEWDEEEGRSPVQRFRTEVTSAAGRPLAVQGRYNPLTGSLSYALILRTEGRIYGLDMGKEHHNPRCDRVGAVHTHSWSERFRDQEAHAPRGAAARDADPVAAWARFCAAARIAHDGLLERPPAPLGGPPL